MDFKALRAKRNDKARSLIESSGGKVDASTWTPDEKLDADVKTGMRPISRRAFKAGGKVDGDEAKSNLSRSPRGNVGLANTNQRVANEERDGKKHIGGFKKGGRTGKQGGGETTQADLDSYARTTEQPHPSRMAPKASMRPMTRSDAAAQAMLDAEHDGMPGDDAKYKRGGKAEKFEGSAKDEMQDKKLAAKRGMSMKEWEASKADDKHDMQKSMKGLKSGGRAAKMGGGGMGMMSPAGRMMQDPKSMSPMAMATGMKKGGKAMHHDDCMCKACGGAPMAKKDGGKADMEDEKRTARATGGRAKGKTNIVINVMPHSGAKAAPGILPPAPMPPIGGPPPMGGGMPPAPPSHMSLPPGLMAAMSGASGTPPPGAGPMARKTGGKVYPKMKFGAGSGKGRLEKVEKYGKDA